MASQLFIGLMSGTSLDGVDVALVTFNHLQQPQLLKTHFVDYSADLRTQILALQHPTDNELEKTALIGNTLAHLYAKNDYNNLIITERGHASQENPRAKRPEK